jgi:hypothetical protein
VNAAKYFFRAPAEWLPLMRHRADEEGVTLSEGIRGAVAAWLEKESPVAVAPPAIQPPARFKPLGSFTSVPADEAGQAAYAGVDDLSRRCAAPGPT